MIICKFRNTVLGFSLIVSLTACEGIPGLLGVALDESLLTDAVSDAAELVLVTPVRKMTFAPVGKTTSGVSLNPLLSRSIRNFDRVEVNFAADTVEKLNEQNDYNVFAWRTAARAIGHGELSCDVAPAPKVISPTLIAAAGAILKTATLVATFSPIQGNTLVSYYDSSADDKLVRFLVLDGKVETCPDFSP